ncbi:hypothetical protein W911_12500 [Hyphomicrobium nitrativorans NL23]|uniref:Gene transfer agent protein n=1 Tax=Hyphomicrobium nitrativorans NL23 TaxID=1029756 RepID=V5SEW9_9HYPH|nr:DUF3168 domain-containing protein [Hyphomicrobium nitrativorans]AHB49042.1 hypothetical protein W911_12500 [Hyphomicrobium nitrativorans NL23]
MSSAAWELQKAVYGALVANADLVAALGGARIYDEVPRGAAFPYVTLGPTTTRDWSTGTEEGAEHALTLMAWSKAPGAREVHLVLDALRAALHEAALSVSGQRLVSIRHEASDTVRERDGETWQGIARFRAVTEPNP